MKAETRNGLLDQLLNDRCDLYGVRNTICYLLDVGLTKEDILELGFSAQDVAYIEEHIDDTFDCE